jgi:hypothetical protein
MKNQLDLCLIKEYRSGSFSHVLKKIGKHHEPRKRTTYAADGTSGGTRVGAISFL